MPRATLLISAAAILCYLVPDIAALLVYVRTAILSGEIWRLVTSHLVHFSTGHLLLNLGAFLIVGGFLERRVGARHLLIWMAALSLLPVALLLVLPGMAYYGGLSALTYGLVVVICVREMDGSTRPGRWMAALALTIGLAGLPAVADRSLIPVLNPDDVRVVWQAHVGAILVALVGSFAIRWLRARVDPGGRTV